MNKHAQPERHFKGLPLSEGCTVAAVCLFNDRRHVNLPRYRVGGSDREHERQRVQRAIKAAARQLDALRVKVEERLGPAEAEIFVAHKMILEDKILHAKIFEFIDEEHLNAESAVSRALDMYEEKLLEVDDEYIKERATDFGDVKRRILDAIGDTKPELQCTDMKHCQKGFNRIVVAEELTPSLTMELDTERTMGFVTERGGVNSHAAILARALGIPAVSGLPGIRDHVTCGTEILVNGSTGEIVIWPTEETVTRAHAEQTHEIRLPSAVPAVTGFKVNANINLPTDIDAALQMQAEGIGLYRTEFEILAAGRFFAEDELYRRYLSVAQAMAGTMVIFRLYDLGSDKSLPFVKWPAEENPSLGWRGARLLLGERKLLRIQARALARTSEGGRVHVMYPMIVDGAQFLELKAAFLEAIEGVPHGIIRHGVMFEVPSACIQAEDILQEADFGSIGSNDLTQYLFAVDRDNEKVSYDYNPDRPVFWNLMADMSDAARRTGKPLSICGELAGYPEYVEKLIALGFSSVSVSARRIPAVRMAARQAMEKADHADVVSREVTP